MNKIWKRFGIYEAIVSVFFILITVFYIINKDFLKYVVPKDIAGYLFWLSLGLWLGFVTCKYEFKRVWNKMKPEEQKSEANIGNPPISPN